MQIPSGGIYPLVFEKALDFLNGAVAFPQKRARCVAQGMRTDLNISTKGAVGVIDYHLAYRFGTDGMITIASALASIMKAVREDVEPEYGALNGRIDRQIDLAITESHRNSNIPVEI